MCLTGAQLLDEDRYTLRSCISTPSFHLTTCQTGMPHEGYVAEAARVISYDNIVNLTHTPRELSSENFQVI